MEQGQRSEPEYAAWIGVDWADKEHAWSLQPAAGGPRERGKLRQTPEAIEEWAAGWAQRFPGQRVAVAVEQKKGALLYALRKYSHLVLYPVPPLLASRYRAAVYPSGRKSDPLDADVLLEILQQQRDKLSPLETETPEVRKLQLLVEHRRNLVDNRTAVTNRIRSHLKICFPQVLDWFDALDAPIFAAFLHRWPTLPQAQAASDEELTQFFHTHGSRSRQRIEQRILSLRQARPLITDPAIIEPLVLLVLSLLPQVAQLGAAVAEFDKAIAATTALLPDSAIFASFPGAGPALAPRLMAAFGTQRTRWQDAAELINFSGISPITVASGNSRQVRFRKACPKFLRQTFHEYAASSRLFCPWAQAYYAEQRAKGKKHHAAIRSLAFKWLRILFACWFSSTPYQEELYLKARTLRQGSPPRPKRRPAVRPAFKKQDGFHKFDGFAS